MDCVFCKIISEEIPAHKVYEDDECIAFLDIEPVNLGHTLVVPKKHAEDVLASSDPDVEHLFRTVKRIGRAMIISGLGDGFNIGVNTGSAAGQVIPHTHVHVIPRTLDDGLRLWGKRAVTDEDLKSAAEKITLSMKG